MKSITELIPVPIIRPRGDKQCRTKFLASTGEMDSGTTRPDSPILDRSGKEGGKMQRCEHLSLSNMSQVQTLVLAS